MIVGADEFSVSVAGEMVPCVRIIRKYHQLENTYYTDMYYRRDCPLGGFTPMFCVFRNLTDHERPVTNSWRGSMHPFRYTRVVAASEYRLTKLFREENLNTSVACIRNFPVESKGLTSITLPPNAFVGENRQIIPHIEDIFSEWSGDLSDYINKSQRFVANDHDNYLLTSLFEHSCGGMLSLSIWFMADVYRECRYDFDMTMETIHERCDTVLDMALVQCLTELPFFDKCRNSLPTAEQMHPDDGIFLYTMHGRYVVVQYINHFHNEFWVSITDVVEKFLQDKEDKNRHPLLQRATENDNLFDDMTDNCLSDDVLFR